MYELDNKVAIVTGASRGIGAAIAIKLAEAGVKQLLVSRSVPDPYVLEALDKTGQPYKHFPADLSKMESIAPVIQAALDEYGRIDILVNNAGLNRRAPVLEYTEEDWDVIQNTNLKIPFFLAQAAARQMVAQGGRGKIINTCSMMSFQGGIVVPAYAAAKHGLAGITKAMANELAPKNINVNGIAPGYIKTEVTTALQNDPVRNPAIVARIPQGDWGNPADIAGAAIFLASPLSDYVDGHILVVDGGWLSR